MKCCIAFVCVFALVLFAAPAFAQQKATIQNVPEIQYTSVPNLLKVPPGETLGEAVGIATNSKGHIFVYFRSNNTRLWEFDKNGNFVKAWGSRGQGPGQFEDVHTIAADAKGNVYVGDRFNRRIQVFDGDGNFKTMYTNVGAPWAVCITPGPHQYLYSSNSSGTTNMDNGEIYKMELDGRIIGKFGHGGKRLKEFMAVHEMDCRNENELYVGEISNWRVQKITLHPNQMK